MFISPRCSTYVKQKLCSLDGQCLGTIYMTSVAAMLHDHYQSRYKLFPFNSGIWNIFREVGCILLRYNNK
jgi:hypothetical protein